MSSYVHAGTAYGGQGQAGNKRFPEDAPSKNISRCGAAALPSGKAIVQEARTIRPGTSVNGGGQGVIATIHRRGSGIGNY